VQRSTRINCLRIYLAATIALARCGPSESSAGSRVVDSDEAHTPAGQISGTQANVGPAEFVPADDGQYKNESAAKNSQITNDALQTVSAVEKKVQLQGLVAVHDIDPHLGHDIPIKKPALKDKRIDIQLSPEERLSRVYLQKEVAYKLKKANSILMDSHPNLRLYPVAGVRPLSIQKKMWNEARKIGATRYFANPFRGGSMHNFGAAIDITIVDINSRQELDMGAEVGHLGPLAQPRHEQEFLRKGELTAAQVANRRLLRSVMGRAGFYGIIIEWWHFNGFPRHVIRQKYKIVE
jgi:D-alanyl-D-alanine dipeptidase